MFSDRKICSGTADIAEKEDFHPISKQEVDSALESMYKAKCQENGMYISKNGWWSTHIYWNIKLDIHLITPGSINQTETSYHNDFSCQLNQSCSYFICLPSDCQFWGSGTSGHGMSIESKFCISAHYYTNLLTFIFRYVQELLMIPFFF